jgi:hypothetical protein
MKKQNELSLPVMETQNLPVIKYFELDKSVTIDNYKEVALPVDYDIEFINRMVKGKLPYHYFENVITQPDYERRFLFYSQLWINKKLYEDISDIIDEYGINIKPGTFCLYLLLVKWCDNLLIQWKAGQELSDRERSIHEIVNFTKTLNELRTDNTKNVEINIIVKNTPPDIVYGRLLIDELIKWEDKYYGSSRIIERIEMQMEYIFCIKDKAEITGYNDSYKQNYRYYVVKSLDKWLSELLLIQSVRINIIRKAFTRLEIFDFNSETGSDDLNDRIYQRLKRKKPNPIKE